MRAQRTRIQGAAVKSGDSRYASYEEKVNLTGKAMVGLVINEYEMEEERTSLYFKLKIYACDDLESIINDDYHGYYLDELTCLTKRVQKCSRLIFVWTFGGRGIDFLDGHGILFNVRFFKLN